MLSCMVSEALNPGLFVEFGVADGSSLNFIARLLQGRDPGKPAPRVFGFDSFQGLPERWAGIEIGTFAQSELPSVETNARLVVGMIQDVLTGFLANHEGPVSFIHMDTDLYSSCRYVLEELLRNHRLVPGTIVQFDELYNYPNWFQDGEYRALTELLPSGSLGYEFIGFVRTPLGNGTQAAIRLVHRG